MSNKQLSVPKLPKVQKKPIDPEKVADHLADYLVNLDGAQNDPNYEEATRILEGISRHNASLNIPEDNGPINPPS